MDQRRIFSSLVEKLDLFGVSYNFQLDNKEKFKTFTGGTISIFFYIITLILFIGFGQNLYNRKNPKVSFSSEILDYERKRLSNQNFTLAFRIENIDGIQVINNSIVSSEVTFSHYEMQANGKWNLESKEVNQSLTYRKCSEMVDTPDKERMYNISLAAWYCVNFDNFTFGGFWDGKFVYSIQIFSRVCKSNNKNGYKCLEHEQLVKEFADANLWYSYLFMETSPVMDNYEKPIQNYLKNNYEFLNMKLHKRNGQIFKTVSMDNDRGWLFENIHELSFISNDYFMHDVGLNEAGDDETLYTHNIYFGKKRDNYSRSYLKMQELFASVGGFANLFLTIMNICSFFLSSYAKNLLILERFKFFVGDSDKSSVFLSACYATNKIKNIIDDVSKIKNVVVSNNNFVNNNEINNIDNNDFGKIFGDEINKNNNVKNFQNNWSNNKGILTNDDNHIFEKGKSFINKITKNNDPPYIFEKKNNENTSQNLIDLRINKDDVIKNNNRNEIKFKNIKEKTNNNDNVYMGVKIIQEINTFSNKEQVISKSDDAIVMKKSEEEINAYRENLNNLNINFQQEAQKASKNNQDKNTENNFISNSSSNNLNETANQKGLFIHLSVVGFFVNKIFSSCRRRKGGASSMNGKLAKLQFSTGIKGLDPKNKIYNNVSNNNNKRNYANKENSEIHVFKEEEKGAVPRNPNESKKYLNNNQGQKNNDTSFFSKELFIYDIYPIYEMNLNKFFDVLNYLNLIQDVKA